MKIEFPTAHECYTWTKQGVESKAWTALKRAIDEARGSGYYKVNYSFGFTLHEPFRMEMQDKLREMGYDARVSEDSVLVSWSTPLPDRTKKVRRSIWQRVKDAEWGAG